MKSGHGEKSKQALPTLPREMSGWLRSLHALKTENPRFFDNLIGGIGAGTTELHIVRPILDG